MIVKMKFLSISGPKNDIDRVCEVYLSKYEMQLENAAAELKTTDNLQPFVEVNPYKEPLAKAEQFSALLADEDQRINVSMNQEDMLNLIRDVNHAYLDLLESQKISYAKFDSDYVSRYKEDKTSFEDVLKDVEALFGLKPQGEEGDKLVLTDYELEQLRAAYEKSVNGTAASQYEQEEYVLYGTYEPLSVTLTHIINNKSGISFTSYSHTGLPVAVLAHGVNAGQFNGYYDNTQIYHKLAGMLGIA